MEARNVGLLVAAVVVLGFAEGSAQGRGDGAFQPLLADPKQPQFFATYLWDRSPRLGSRLASVGFGQTISLVRESDWELAIAAGVFSQFNMQSATNDLINTDYLVGLPLTYRTAPGRRDSACTTRASTWATSTSSTPTRSALT